MTGEENPHIVRLLGHSALPYSCLSDIELLSRQGGTQFPRCADAVSRSREDKAPARSYCSRASLVRRDLTAAEKAWSGSYEVGEVLHYYRGSAKLGIPAKSYATIEAVDREQNLLTVRTTDRAVHTYRPTQLHGVEVFRPEQRVFAVGERIQFRAPFKEQKIANGALGRIEQIDQEKGTATLRMDNGKTFAAPWDALRHIEYGYTTTSMEDRVFLR